MNLRFVDGREQRIIPRRPVFHSSVIADTTTVEIDVYARWFLRAERHRAARVHIGVHSHWLMLVDLWVAEAERRDVCTTSLCIAGGVPGTTGLRHIEQLVVMGMIVEARDPFDRRRRYFRLTDRARTVVEAQLAAEVAMITPTISKGGGNA